MNNIEIKILMLLFSILIEFNVFAQNYPQKPVRLIVPYSPGGPVDIVGRITAQKLSEKYNIQFVVDNRAGGGGNIALEIVARSFPDGYTLLMGANGTNAINPSLYNNLTVDPIKELRPITMVASSSMILVAHPSATFQTVKELISFAKLKPGTINFASSGNGSTAHLSGELFKNLSGVSMMHIPYKGAGPALVDLVAGQTQIMFTGLSSTIPYIKIGRLKAIAVSGDKRSPLFPNIPTIQEELKDYEVFTWYGVFSPRNTRPAIIENLNKTLSVIFKSPDTQQQITAIGAETKTMSAVEFENIILVEVKKWKKVISDSKIKPD